MAITRKGEVRRTALLEAVVRVLEREGPTGVTHRAVAAEAGVPLAAATYYFANLDDLLVSALTLATQQQVALIAGLGAWDIPGVARLLFDVTHGNRAAAIAQYELLFLAMRRDSLRPAADLWYRTLEDAVNQRVSDPRAARVIALAIDGLLLRMLWTGEPSTQESIEASLRDILRA
ncbi:TetR/AcrR family transcriptional regulator [Glaciihabitans sp. dw_435]|uniref:TetR/AcrR family transcriptional regulator n=1 Tax=Glaciihabitans sp. dw_435 TaxID=2720081 RepID=UPI001BD2C82E|nr:TetR family transcriptional regulator [Glaciihabitans sp. dw_435]